MIDPNEVEILMEMGMALDDVVEAGEETEDEECCDTYDIC